MSLTLSFYFAGEWNQVTLYKPAGSLVKTTDVSRIWQLLDISNWDLTWEKCFKNVNNIGYYFNVLMKFIIISTITLLLWLACCCEYKWVRSCVLRFRLYTFWHGDARFKYELLWYIHFRLSLSMLFNIMYEIWDYQYYSITPILLT